MIPTREQAMEILKEYNKNESLITHALSVEAVMRHYAELYNEDVEFWGAVGLLHDLDYELYPDEHCKKVIELLEGKGVDEKMIRAIVSHGYNICSDVEPVHTMEKILYTTDELTGLITATALMRPSKSMSDLEYKSVWKKYKSANFAVGVDRSIIEKGCEMLGLELKSIIEEVIVAMRKVSADIGL